MAMVASERPSRSQATYRSPKTTSGAGASRATRARSFGQSARERSRGSIAASGSSARGGGAGRASRWSAARRAVTSPCAVAGRPEGRRAAAERAEAVEIVARDPAVGAVDVVIGGDGVDPGRHGAHRRRVVVDGEPVAEEERVGIGGTERVVGEMVVALGHDAGPAA